MTRRRRGRAFVAVLLSLVVIAGLLVAGDVYLRARTEAHLERELQDSLPAVSPDVQVQIGGLLFIPQLIAGSIDQADVTAGKVNIDAMTATDVHVQLRGVSTSEPFVAESLTIHASAPTATLQTMTERAGVPPEVVVEVDDGDLRMSTTVFGVQLRGNLIPEARGRSIGLQITELDLGGVQIDPSELPAGLGELLTTIEIPLTDLPQDLELTHIEPVAGQMELQLRGEHVNLSELSADPG